jgi:hypothetical protein
MSNHVLSLVLKTGEKETNRVDFQLGARLPDYFTVDPLAAFRNMLAGDIEFHNNYLNSQAAMEDALKTMLHVLARAVQAK